MIEGSGTTPTPGFAIRPGDYAPPAGPSVPYQPGPPPGYFYPVSGHYLPPPPPPTAPGGARLADPGDRFLAYLLDALILFALNLIPLIAVLFVFASRMSKIVDDSFNADRIAAEQGRMASPSTLMTQALELELVALAILLPIMLAISYLYLVEYHASKGQTIGKRVMKLRVVSVVDGSPATKLALRKRWLVTQPASLFAPYFTYADSLWLAWDKPYRQCLHDKCASTVVVKLTT